MRKSDRELILKEAEWVWSEMEDFVRQVQRYRLSYVTAVFASIGWILGQLVDRQNTTLDLNGLRRNSAVATVILLIPMINGLFFLLMMEAARQIQSLARYRFLLSCELGSKPPVWRWELFKATPEGSVRLWTNPSNIFLGLFAVGTSLGSFGFANPAVGDPIVNTVRWCSVVFTVALSAAVIGAGWPRRYQNDVAAPPPSAGRLLGPEDRPSEPGVFYDALRPTWARSEGAPRTLRATVADAVPSPSNVGSPP